MRSRTSHRFLYGAWWAACSHQNLTLACGARQLHKSKNSAFVSIASLHVHVHCEHNYEHEADLNRLSQIGLRQDEASNIVYLVVD